jgi:hypothetical protein
MPGDMLSSGSTMAGYMDILIPLLVIEAVLIALTSGLYFLAVHTRAPLRDDVVERVFWAFRRVRKFTGAAFAVSFVLFYISLFMEGLYAVALRDSSLALFLLAGWGGLLRGGWIYFALKRPPSKKKPKSRKPAPRKKRTT